MPFLILDSEHCKAVQLLVLTGRTGQSFAFTNIEDLMNFINVFYKNPIAAHFAYEQCFVPKLGRINA